MKGLALIRNRLGIGAALLAVWSQPGAAIDTGKAAQPAARPASAPLEARSEEGLVYPFVVVPRRIELSQRQVDEVRDSVVKQVTSYHHSLAESNRSAAESHAEEISERAKAYAHSEWNRQHVQQVLSSQHQASQAIFYVVLFIVATALLLTIYQFIRDSALAERASALILGREGDLTKGRRRSVPSTAMKPELPAVELGEAERPQESGRAMAPLSETAVLRLTELAAENPQSRDAVFEVLKLAKAQHNITFGPTGLQLGSQFVGLVVLSFSLAFFYLYLNNVYPISFKYPTVSETTQDSGAAAPKEELPASATKQEPPASAAKKNSK
jgi:hypothetical protein